MAISPMTRAVAGTIASASDYNVVLDNVDDVDSRLASVEDAGGSGIFFHGWITDTEYVVNTGGGSGGVNFDFSSAGLAYNERGGFTVSGHQILVPSSGRYLITAQAAWLSGTAPSGGATTGIYALRDGTAGATDAVAAKETKFPGNEDDIIEQISGVANCTSTAYLAYRLYTNTTTERSVRGVGSYGGTYIYITKDA